jgi:hypothetical protein
MNGSEHSFRRGVAPLVATLAICSAIAFWISNGVGKWDGDLDNAWHHYEYLAEGFLHGHTYLSVDPDPRLLGLTDPFDPVASAHLRLWDATLYHGKYYLYFGPTPALFMLPWRIVTGHEPAQRLVVASFAVCGLAALSLLLWEIRERHFKGLPALSLAGILAVAFSASWLPVVLRRSAVWELPIVAAMACLWWAFYFLWKFHGSGGKARWAVAAGVAVALMMGSRVTSLFSAAAVTFLFLVPVAGPRSGAIRARAVGLITAALAFAGGCALLLYNRERFGRWREFGETFQLRGYDERATSHFSLSYVPFNAHAYVLGLPKLGPYFPFLHPYWTDDTPFGHLGFDDFFGVPFMVPVHVAAIFACSWAWQNRRAVGNRAIEAVIIGAGCSSVLTGLLFLTFAGDCSRYIADVSGGPTVVSAIGLMAVFGSDDGPRMGGRIRLFAGLASLWTVVCVGLASAEYRGFMKETNPRVYSAIGHALDYPSYWWARREGVVFGPATVVVHVPAVAPPGDTALVANGWPELVNHLVIHQSGEGRFRLALTVNSHHVLDTADLSASEGQLLVRVNAPWLYPPAESPYWDAVRDPAIRLQRLTNFSIECGSHGVQVFSTHFGEPVELAPVVRDADPSAPDAPFVQYFHLTAPSP